MLRYGTVHTGKTRPVYSDILFAVLSDRFRLGQANRADRRVAEDNRRNQIEIHFDLCHFGIEEPLGQQAPGFYGDRGDETLDEDSRPGEGFLPDLGMLWEGATAPAQHRGVRVVNLRIGIVLTPEGGALAKMLPVFRLGLGGNLGNGRMFMSWISLEDILHAIRFCIDNPSVSGPVNLVAPNPVTNAELTKALGTLLDRPTIFPVPSFLLKLAPGGMANEVLLASAKVLPRRLQQAGFSFQHPKLEDALSQMLSNSD